VLDAEGEPLRLGLEAEPFLVSPNQREAEALVGQEFYEHQDFAYALEHIAELGARNVLITNESGCFARLRDGRETYRFRVLAPQVEPVSAVGSGDVLLAGYVAAVLDKRSTEDALRSAVAAGAASTLELGAGRLDPRVASQLTQDVQLTDFEAVTSDR
jgi:fructose-1-phosphate kinase PfkB-like protein